MATQSAPMPYLPYDVVEVIFTFLDSNSFVAAAQTCREWSQIGQRQKKNNKLWEKICREELTTDDILTVQQFFNGPPPDWYLVMKCCRRWQKIPLATHDITNLSDCLTTHYGVNKHIYCARATGDKIVVGFSNFGYYVFKNLEFDSYFPMKNRHPQKFFIFQPDIVVDVGRHVQIIQLSKQNQSCSHFIEDQLTTGCISIDRTKQRIYVYSHGKLYLLSKSDEILDLPVAAVAAAAGDEYPVAHDIVSVHYDPGQVILVSVWGDSVTMFNDFGILYKLDDRGIMRKVVTYDHPHQYTLQNCYIFLEETIILVTASAQVIILRDGKWRIVEAMRIFHSYPRTIHLHGRILFIGLDSGMVYIYRCDDIMELNFTDTTLYTQHYLTSDPIISLDVVENEANIQLVAATRHEVFIDKIGGY